ncbi:MAG: hypothetical protein U0175_29160 [Caldilineaceae bacterium]
MTLELSTRERDYIVKLLETAYKDLRQEIHHTHTSTFKDELKLDEEMVHQLIEKLKALAA